MGSEMCIRDSLSTSVLDHRKRVVEKIELAQNLARENIQRPQQKMKEYYDRNASQPLFEIGQRVWVYTPKAKKGSSCIIGLVRTESSSNRLLFIIGCVPKATTRLLSNEDMILALAGQFKKLSLNFSGS